MKRAIVIEIFMVCSVLQALGQSFEVASVKPSDPGAPGMSLGRSPGGHFKASNTPLRFLIAWAYDIRNDRLFGDATWLDTDRFDILAKAADANASFSDMRLMMQSLLANRFKLIVHREMRDLPMYILVVDKNGAKIHPTEPDGSPGEDSLKMSDDNHLIGTKVSAQTLAKALSNELGLSVQDQTGIKGVFDFKLEWAPDSATQSDGSAVGAAATMPNSPSVFSALQEQLGLRLESRKGPAEVVVIDHVEKSPTEN